MHKVAEVLADGLDIPLVHLADTTAAALRRADLGHVGLLGTGFTMSQPFYRDRRAAHGLRVTVPDEADQGAVQRIIYEELVLGVVSEPSRGSTAT